VRALSKKAVLQRVRLDLNELIEEVVLLVRREASSQGVSLRLELTPGLAPVMGDRIQLQQVIINLVMNGVDAMAAETDRPRALSIRTGPLGAGEVVVAIEDCGIGVDPANADRLFDAFFTTKPKGLGMGLSICRSIIEAHDGRIWASPNAGPGATFQIALSSCAAPST
jgi:signal transduction histidine kinase